MRQRPRQLDVAEVVLGEDDRLMRRCGQRGQHVVAVVGLPVAGRSAQVLRPGRRRPPVKDLQTSGQLLIGSMCAQ